MTFYIYLSIGAFLVLTFILLNYKFKWYTKENYEYEETDVSLIGTLLAILVAWPIVILMCIFILIITNYIPKILPKKYYNSK